MSCGSVKLPSLNSRRYFCPPFVAQYSGLDGNMTVISVASPYSAGCIRSAPPLTSGSGITGDTAFMRLTPPVTGENTARDKEMTA